MQTQRGLLLKTLPAGYTLPVMKKFNDLGAMLQAYMGPMSQQVFADYVGIDPNAVARSTRGLPMPQEAAEKIAKFFRMNAETRAQFFEHLERARALNHKAAGPYVQRIEDRLDRAERSLLKIARMIPPSGPISDKALDKLREIANAVIERYEPSTKD
jgi:hypothetical protein